MAKANTRSAYEPERHGDTIHMVVRAAVPGDEEAIATIDGEREPRLVEEPAPLIRLALTSTVGENSKSYVCVALVDDQVVGYGKCAYIAWSDNTEDSVLPDGWYLTGLEVLRGHRRKGIGRALTIHRIDWLRQRADVLYYFTGDRNHPSMDLHRALGFSEVAHGVAIPLPPPFSNEELHLLGKLTLC